MKKNIGQILIECTLSNVEELPCDSYQMQLEWYQNAAFKTPCLSQTMSYSYIGEPHELNATEMALGEVWAQLIRVIFANLGEDKEILENFNSQLEAFLQKLYPTTRLKTTFSQSTGEKYENRPVAVEEKKIWASDTDTKADTEYLFQLFDQWVALSEQPDADAEILKKQFDSFGFYLGDLLATRLPPQKQVNFFVSPLNDLCNVGELIATAQKGGGTIWSTNRYCSFGDIVLFYFTKEGGKIFKDVEFEGKNGDFFAGLPGSIFAAGRMLTDSLRQAKKGLFYWNSRAFVGDIKIFDHPIAMDDINNSEGISLTRHFRDSRGGIRQPKSLYGHDDYLNSFKALLFSKNPSLKDTYLNFSSFWPETIPAPDSQNWAKEMGKADARIFKDKDVNRNLNQKHVNNFFQDEEGVRKMFIDPLLKLALPDDAKTIPEFKTHSHKNIRIDYCIEKNGKRLPIEAKFDIKTDHSIDWQRVNEYLEISHNGTGLLIDINGVFILRRNSSCRELLFERIGMNDDSVKKLKKWISDFFKKS